MTDAQQLVGRSPEELVDIKLTRGGAYMLARLEESGVVNGVVARKLQFILKDDAVILNINIPYEDIVFLVQSLSTYARHDATMANSMSNLKWLKTAKARDSLVGTLTEAQENIAGAISELEGMKFDPPPEATDEKAP